MRVLLFGGAGLLGTDVRASAPEGVVVIAPRSIEADITDAGAVARILDTARPAWVINAAAYTFVDRAESELELAQRVNGVAPRILGEACARRGVRMVHYSTDYVFAGTSDRPYREDDPVDPVNAYGRTKLEGERGVIRSGAEALLIRTSWLYGLHGRSFPRTMWERAMRGQATRVVNDQQGRPTCTADLAGVTWTLLACAARGVVHVSGSGTPTTWHGIADRVFQRAGRGELLQACATTDHPTPARRPSYSVLDTGKLERLAGRAMPDWGDSLDRFLTALAAE